jgi:hypothetical protein
VPLKIKTFEKKQRGNVQANSPSVLVDMKTVLALNQKRPSGHDHGWHFLAYASISTPRGKLLLRAAKMPPPNPAVKVQGIRSRSHMSQGGCERKTLHRSQRRHPRSAFPDFELP